MHSCGVYNGKLDSDPFAPLEVTQGLPKSLHKATNALPNTIGNAPKFGRVRQNSCHDDEFHDTRRFLQRGVTQGIYTHKQARATFQHLVRKKQTLYLPQF